MTILQIALRGLRARAFTTFLIALGIALGVGLTAAVLILQAELDRTYRRQSAGYALVVGPSGSGLELVLNSVYHVGESRGLIPYSALRELESESWRRYVKRAVPMAVGDSFRGYRVVATTGAFFDPIVPQPPGTTTEKFARGGPFADDAEALVAAVDDLRRKRRVDPATVRREAVLGAEVARRTGLGPGAEIEPSHGVEDGVEHAEDARWRVTGVLRPTGTPIDRVVFVNLDSFYRISEHAGGRMPVTGEAGLSSILLFPRRGHAKLVLLSNLRKRPDLQVADVPTEIRRLLDLIGNVDQLFLAVSLAVAAVALLSVMVALFNAMNERRRELAIFRALGMPRRNLVGIVALEAALIGALGALLGLLLAHVGLALASDRIAENTGLRIRAGAIEGFEPLLILATVGAAVLAGMIPAWKAYRTDVARHLAPSN